MNLSPGAIECAEFPKSDAPVRLMVVFSATLAIAPIAILAAIAASGHKFYTEEYDMAYGILAVVGVALLSLLTLVLLISRAPTRRFAVKSLLVTVVLVSTFFLVALVNSI